MLSPTTRHLTARARDSRMIDPCEPSRAHIHVHHGAPILGRIRRHGTARIARQLHRGVGGCLPGSLTKLGATLLKAASPVAGLTLLDPAGSTINTDSATPMFPWPMPGLPGGLIIIGAGGQPKPSHHHHPIPITEPAGISLFLLAALAWVSLRRRVKPS